MYLYKSKGTITENLWKMVESFAYFLAVSTAGYYIFKKLKRENP
jgi:hypothetical protein